MGTLMTVLNEESLWWSRTADRQCSAPQTFSAVAVSANCSRRWNEKVKSPCFSRTGCACRHEKLDEASTCALTRTVSYISGKTCNLVRAFLPVHFMRLHLAKREKKKTVLLPEWFLFVLQCQMDFISFSLDFHTPPHSLKQLSGTLSHSAPKTCQPVFCQQRLMKSVSWYAAIFLFFFL